MSTHIFHEHNNTPMHTCFKITALPPNRALTVLKMLNNISFGEKKQQKKNRLNIKSNRVFRKHTGINALYDCVANRVTKTMLFLTIAGSQRAESFTIEPGSHPSCSINRANCWSYKHPSITAARSWCGGHVHLQTLWFTSTGTNNPYY